MEQEGQHIALGISSTVSVPGGGGENTPAENQTAQLMMYAQVFLTLATKTFGPTVPTVSNNKPYKVYYVFSILVFIFDFLFVLYFAALVAGAGVPPKNKMKLWIYGAVAISFFTFIFGASLLLAA